MDEGMPEFIDKLSIYSLTCALRDLNAVLDKGKSLTFAEVYDHLDSGDLVEFLQERLGPNLFSLVRPGIDQNKFFNLRLRFAKVLWPAGINVTAVSGRKLSLDCSLRGTRHQQ
jgi:hypothetical protein